MRYHDSRWGAGLGLAALGIVLAIFITAPLVVGGRGEQPRRASEASATATVLPARTPRPPSVGQGSATPVEEGTSESAKGSWLLPTPQPAITATLDDAGEAQMDEQPPFKRPGEGSIPSASTTPFTKPPKPETQPTQFAVPATSLRAAIEASRWPPHLWLAVQQVVMCESRGLTTAVSPAGYRGLMQVAPWLHGPVPTDAVGQLNQGFDVWRKQGWQAWPICGAR